MKNFFCVLLALVFASGLVYFASAEEDKPKTFRSGDYKYILLEDGSVEIVKYGGKEEVLAIPSELDGKKVTAIGENIHTFSTLISVTIPDSVTEIRSNPFSSYSSLTEIIVSPDHPTLAVIDNVLFSKPDNRLICYPSGLTNTEYTIPQGVQAVGDYAFSRCKSLTAITIPDSVTSIGDRAFHGCNSLSNVAIPDSVTSIGEFAFSSCTSLTSISIPGSVASIGEQAFFNCKSLTSVTFSDSVTEIGSNPFRDCSSLTEIIVSPDHPTLAVIDNVLFSRQDKRLVCYPHGLTALEYTIPQGIQIIGEYAFWDCDSLISVTIPDSVTNIENHAFFKCSSLTSITIPDSVTSIGIVVFSQCSSLTSITIPDSVTSISKSSFYSCESLTTVTIPDSVTSIGDTAFSGCESLTSITIPDSVTSIGEKAFDLCPAILTVGQDSYAKQYCIDNNLPYTCPD